MQFLDRHLAYLIGMLEAEAGPFVEEQTRLEALDAIASRLRRLGSQTGEERPPQIAAWLATRPSEDERTAPSEPGDPDPKRDRWWRVRHHPIGAPATGATQALIRLLADIATFYEFVDDSLVDPDFAVRQLESLTAMLETLDASDRRWAQTELRAYGLQLRVAGEPVAASSVLLMAEDLAEEG